MTLANIESKFDTFIKEAYGGLGQPGSPIDDVDQDNSRLDTTELQDKINLYLSKVSYKPTVNPNYILDALRVKLNIIGIDYDKPYVFGETGSTTVPIRRFGGRFGVLNTRGDIGHDDGWPEGWEPLGLEFSWTKYSGAYTISVKLVPHATEVKRSNPWKTTTEEMLRESSVAAKVAQSKEDHPERYCPIKRCLWNTAKQTDTRYCPRHVHLEVKPKQTAAPTLPISESTLTESDDVHSALKDHGFEHKDSREFALKGGKIRKMEPYSHPTKGHIIVRNDNKFQHSTRLQYPYANPDKLGSHSELRSHLESLKESTVPLSPTCKGCGTKIDPGYKSTAPNARSKRNMHICNTCWDQGDNVIRSAGGSGGHK